MEEKKESIREFVGKINKSHEPKTHKISHCLGSRDAWKWVRKNKWKALGGKPFDQLLYSKIIDAVNKNIVELIIEGHQVEFPHHMGSLRLKKLKLGSFLKNGKVVNTYTVDWKKTLNLWYEDEEMLKAHVKVKKNHEDYHHIEFADVNTPFPNRQFYLFRPNRSLAKKIGRLSFEGKIKTFELE